MVENNSNCISLEKHPLIKHKITLLRDKNTSSKDFREILEELTFIIAIEASKNLSLKKKTIQTPLDKYEGGKAQSSIIIPILRAGLGMMNPLLKILPDCKVGFMGVSRNEETLQPSQYYCNIPKIKEEDAVFVLDPMLATGGSIIHTLNYLKSKGVTKVIIISLLATPVGINNIFKEHPNVKIYTAEIDETLGRNGFIIPGLGDAGDRVFNT